MKEIYKIYLAHFFSGLAFIAAFGTLFLLAKGFSQFQISLLFSALTLSMAIFQIPTGAVADTFGHKASVVLGMIFYSLSLFLFILATSFSQFILVMILTGLGMALVSGAFSSLIYDLLNKMDKSAEFEKVQGRAFACYLVASSIAAPIGGYVYQRSPSLTYLLASISALLSGMMVMFIRWEFKKETPSASLYLDKIKEGMIFTFRSKKLLAIAFILSVLYINGFVFSHNLQLPYLLAVGFNVPQIGFIIGIISIFSALVSANSHKISEKIGKINAPVVIIIAMGFSCLALGIINISLSLFLVFLYFFGMTYREPVFINLQQDEASNDQRATVVSTISFITSFAVAVIGPLFGKLIDLYGINSGLVLLGIFTIVFGYLGVRLYSKAQRVIVQKII